MSPDTTGRDADRRTLVLQAANHNTTAKLLTIPAELRSIIHETTAVGKDAELSAFWDGKIPQVINVCHDLRQEARKMYFGSRVFHVDGGWSAPVNSVSLDVATRESIKPQLPQAPYKEMHAFLCKVKFTVDKDLNEERHSTDHHINVVISVHGDKMGLNADYHKCDIKDCERDLRSIALQVVRATETTLKSLMEDRIIALADAEEVRKACGIDANPLSNWFSGVWVTILPQCVLIQNI